MSAPYDFSMQNKEKSITLKTMEDGQVLLYSVSFTPVDTMVFLEGIVLSTLFLIEDTTTFKFIIFHLFS